MRTLTRIAAAGVMAVLTVATAACTGSESPSTQPGTARASSAVSAPSSAAKPVDDGVTTTAEVFGPACAQLPQGDAPGSLTATAAQPVASAVAASPLLTTLASAVGSVPGLADSLDAQQGVTVLAPADPAFVALREQIGQAVFGALLADPNKLAALLEYHVSGTRYDAASLVAAGTVTELTGGTLKIGGTAAAPTITDGKGATANVLCGNIPTRNATVFVIDRVLTPAS